MEVPVLDESKWETMATEPGFGVLLWDARGNRSVAIGAAAKQFDGLAMSRQVLDDRGAPLPDAPTLAATVLRGETTAVLPVVLSTPDSPRQRLWAQAFPVVAGDERLVLVYFRPVWTDMRRAVGLYDPGTGLPNRILLFDRLDQALLRARARRTRTSVVLVEVVIHDRIGAGPRERIMERVAVGLRAAVSAEQTVARYAGNLFAVVLEDPAEPIEAHQTDQTDLVAARLTGTATSAAADGTTRADGVLVRTGWATSAGADTTHAMLERAETRLDR